MEKVKNKSPNCFHWIGFALLIAGYCLLLQLRLVEGFSAWFIGCAIGLFGCEYSKRSKGD